MSTQNEKTSWASAALLAAAGLAVVLLIRRSYLNDAPRISTYTAPPSASVPAPAAPAAPAAPPAAPPSSAGDLEAQARSHVAARRYAAAAAAYRKMLALDPGNASLYNELGLTLHYDGKSAEALEALKKATALEPGLQRAWLSYGYVLTTLGRKAQARVALEKTIALGATTPQGVEARSMLER